MARRTYTKKTRRQKRKAIQQIFFSNACRVFILLFAIGLSVLYIIELNSVSTKGFVIADLERDIQSLEQENEDLSVKISTYRSMQHIQERLKTMPFTNVDDAKYVEMQDGTVVRR